MTKHLRAYSLVETLVAIAILALLMLSITSFISGILSQERRNRALAEVEAQGNYVMYEFAQSARNATAITVPAVASTTSTTLTLASVVPAENPTIFALTNGAVQMKRGATATTTLTSNTVTVSSLIFTNTSAASTKGAIRASLTLGYTNPSNRVDFRYSQTFYTTVTLR